MEKEVSNYIALTPKGRKFEIELGEDQIRFKKKVIEVSIEVGKDGFTYIIHENKRYPIEIVSVNQNKYEVMINNVSYFFSIETPISVKRKELLDKQKPESKTIQILSPMPGKIIDVFVEEGGIIAEGDALLVLEAMKMQNEIASHAAGKIKKVYAKPNDIVNKDDLLIEIER